MLMSAGAPSGHSYAKYQQEPAGPVGACGSGGGGGGGASDSDSALDAAGNEGGGGEPRFSGELGTATACARPAISGAKSDIRRWPANPTANGPK